MDRYPLGRTLPQRDLENLDVKAGHGGTDGSVEEAGDVLCRRDDPVEREKVVQEAALIGPKDVTHRAVQFGELHGRECVRTPEESPHDYF